MSTARTSRLVLKNSVTLSSGSITLTQALNQNGVNSGETLLITNNQGLVLTRDFTVEDGGNIIFSNIENPAENIEGDKFAGLYVSQNITLIVHGEIILGDITSDANNNRDVYGVYNQGIIEISSTGSITMGDISSVNGSAIGIYQESTIQKHSNSNTAGTIKMGNITSSNHDAFGVRNGHLNDVRVHIGNVSGGHEASAIKLFATHDNIGSMSAHVLAGNVTNSGNSFTNGVLVNDLSGSFICKNVSNTNNNVDESNVIGIYCIQVNGSATCGDVSGGFLMVGIQCGQLNGSATCGNLSQGFLPYGIVCTSELHGSATCGDVSGEGQTIVGLSIGDATINGNVIIKSAPTGILIEGTPNVGDGKVIIGAVEGGNSGITESNANALANALAVYVYGNEVVISQPEEAVDPEAPEDPEQPGVSVTYVVNGESVKQYIPRGSFLNEEGSLSSLSITSINNAIGGGGLIPATITNININEVEFTSITNNGFEGCELLTSINIPSSVESIGDAAFINCSALTSIVIPDGVSEIKTNTFANCEELASVVIGSGVTQFQSTPFVGCVSLGVVTFKQNNALNLTFSADDFVNSPVNERLTQDATNTENVSYDGSQVTVDRSQGDVTVVNIPIEGATDESTVKLMRRSLITTTEYNRNFIVAVVDYETGVKQSTETYPISSTTEGVEIEGEEVQVTNFELQSITLRVTIDDVFYPFSEDNYNNVQLV